MRNEIIKKTENTILKNELIKKGEKVLVAFSGGADSVCLLYILKSLEEKLGFKVYACHLNHSLRGLDADRDEEFAKSFCEKIGVEIKTKKCDIKDYARLNNISEELAGREARYSFFFEVMKEKNIEKLAVGHHLDDQAETVLQHLLRGSGIDGLLGIRLIRENVIRPLIDFTKQEILDFCKEEGLDFCTDLTNFEQDYNRNRIRLDLIPKLREFNPNIAKTLSNTAKILADEADFLEETATETKKRIARNNSCEINELLSLHPAVRRRLVRKMIEDVKGTKKDIGWDYTEKILAMAEENNTGKAINLNSNIIARTEYGKLIIEKNEEIKSFSYEIFQDLDFKIPENGVNILIRKTENGDFCFPENAVFKVRTREAGDRICPLGMTGTKKLKDFFIDEKVSRPEREKAVLVLCNNEIAVVFYDNKTFFDRRFYKKNSGNFRITLILRKD